MLERSAYDTGCHEQLDPCAVKQIVWVAERGSLWIPDIELNDVIGGSLSAVHGL
jgi:hypothetical protein